MAANAAKGMRAAQMRLMANRMAWRMQVSVADVRNNYSGCWSIGIEIPVAGGHAL